MANMRAGLYTALALVTIVGGAASAGLLMAWVFAR